MSMDRAFVTKAIKDRINIIEIVKRYVDLRRAGNRWVAPCPFHQETQPSFSVNEEEGFFYCFGCQAAGDVFDFYGRVNGLDFKATLEHLAEEAGVSLDHSGPSPKARQERDEKRNALAMYALAAKHFAQNLTGQAGEVCRSYLKQRQLSSDIITTFELGWSLPEWQGLTNVLRKGGFNVKQGVSAGLLAPNDRGGGYDRFRGRLIFPIKNLSGQVIAFGGRIIGGEDAAKYINSTDSLLYKKGDNLYGLFQARRGISATKTAILTEGYMDVLTLHQFGYTNACGVLGTALTLEQVRRLAGFCSHVELIFDGDAPGRKAALRACEMTLAKGLHCKVVILPEKEDIDSLLQQQGKDAFEELRRFAPDGLDFCIRFLSGSYAPKDALAWVKSFIASVELPELLPKMISRLCQGLDLDEREIRKEVAKLISSGQDQEPRQGTFGAVQPEHSVKKDALDRQVLKFVVRYPQQAPALRDAGIGLVLTEAWAQALWEKIESCAPQYSSEAILALLSKEEKEFWGHCRVMDAPPPGKELEELDDVCALIKRLCLDRQSSACMHALRRTSSKDDYDMELLKALNATLAQKRTIGSADE